MPGLPVPPEDLRLWVGPFADPDLFLRSGRETLALMMDLCGLRPEDAVLDVGCGSGRVALALINYLAPPGHYLGFDPADAPIRWCQTHLTPRAPHFRFVQVDVRNPAYHPAGALPAHALRFPCDSSSVDVALLSSVFTHVLPEDMVAYSHELARVLRPGGRILISYLLMNDAARDAVERRATIFEFRHRLGPCVTFAPANPTEGLAYDEDYAFGVLGEAGLEVETLRYGTWRSNYSYAVEHDWVVARKP